MIPDLMCSSRACRAQAQWALRWRNPAIHHATRRKVWLACPEHKDHLAQYLGERGFLLDVVGVEELTTEDG